MPVTLSEAIVRRRCAALIPYARNARTRSDQQVAKETPEVARAWISSIAPIISALTGLFGVIIRLLAIILGRR